MPKFYQIKITNMWNKVKELSAKGLKTGQSFFWLMDSPLAPVGRLAATHSKPGLWQ